MKISIIIPTCKKEHLLPCLESIRKYTDLNDIEIIVVANGYDGDLEIPDCKVITYPERMGYTFSTNQGIKEAKGDYILLLNDDTILLEQEKNKWIDLLMAPFLKDPKAGLSGPLASWFANRPFLIFFCVLIKREVFDKIGLLDEIYNPGAGEDCDFSFKAMDAGYIVYSVPLGETNRLSGDKMISTFPIYHKAEGTVFDIPEWQQIFNKNTHTLQKKYDQNYRYELTNTFERAVYLKGDEVQGREYARYNWARENATGKNILEIGCSSGFGSQFFPDVIYTGIDYNQKIIDVANWEYRSPLHLFIHQDIITYNLKDYSTIIAFEVIEHLDNGLEIVERLKKHCKTLLITVPYKEPKGFWGHHHRIWGLDETMFPDFEIKYITENGAIADKPADGPINLMLMKWTRKE